MGLKEEERKACAIYLKRDSHKQNPKIQKIKNSGETE
jgi:hypothetical protein